MNNSGRAVGILLGLLSVVCAGAGGASFAVKAADPRFSREVGILLIGGSAFIAVTSIVLLRGAALLAPGIRGEFSTDEEPAIPAPDYDRLASAVRHAASFMWVCAILVAAIIVLNRGGRQIAGFPTVGPDALIDAAIFAILGSGIQARSRAASVAAVLVYVMEMVNAYLTLRSPTLPIIGACFVVVLIRGLLANLRLGRRYIPMRPSAHGRDRINW